MTRVFQSLFLMLASATRQELARHVKYLKAENVLLRSRLPKRIDLEPKERNRLVRLGRKLGSKVIGELVTIVSPATFLKWIRQAARAAAPIAPAVSRRKPGRPRTPEEIRKLILKLARENDWGYTRILSALRQLGIRKITRQTVKNILKDAGLDPGPERGEGTWDDFLRRHMDTLWQSDFLSVKALTKAGFVDLYLLAFIHLGTRRAWISPCTAHPDSAWVTQQGRNLLMHAEDVGLMPEYVQHDRDTKFTAAFDDVFESAGVTINKTVPHSPNLNAFIERFIQTAKQEVFSRFVICGEKHLNHLVREFQAHYNFERSHSSRDHLPPAMEKEPELATTIKMADVACETRLGGLLKHYWRRAA